MDYHRIVEEQRSFFLTGATASLDHRKELLLKLKDILQNEHEVLTEAVFKDLRRLPKATFILEVGSSIVEIDYMIDNLKEWSAPQYVEKTFLTALDTPMIVKDPKGVVLIISPWNYPINMVLLPLIAAIAAGNTVIIKPSEMAPHTADAFSDLFSKNFDQRCIAVVKGGVPETTELLKERFDHILYTGSAPVGKVIMAAAAKHLTPVTLELGGKCPVVVEGDADIEVSAKRIAWGKWTNCGQTCLAPDYILTTAAVKPGLVEGIRKAVKDFYGSDVQTSADYSRIINERHFDRLSSLLDKSTSTILFKGGELDREDLFIPPIVLDATAEDPFMKDEIFGPILPIITVSGLDEALSFIRNGEKPLAAYIFTRSESKVQRLYKETSSGAITVNDVLMHLAVDTLPFGGVGKSGMGRYRGKFGFDTFTHEKALLKRGFFGESLISGRYPPLTDKKFGQLISLIGTRRAIPKWLKQWFSAVPLIIIGIFIGLVLQRLASR